MAKGGSKFSGRGLVPLTAIDPLQLGMSIANSATTGLARGRERAFDELKAMEAGYNRAAKEMDARIKAEQAVFEYQVLKPLELAIKQTQLEYSRNRLRMQRESELASLLAMQMEENTAHNLIQGAASFQNIFTELANSKAKLENEIQNPEANVSDLQQEKEKLLATETALGIDLLTKEKELTAILSLPLGSSRNSVYLRMSAAKQLNSLRRIINKLPGLHPEAFKAYNMNVAMPFIDQLESQEQKQRFIARIANRQTPLTEEQAKEIYQEIKSPVNQSKFDVGDWASNTKSLLEMQKSLVLSDKANMLSPEGKAILNVVNDLISRQSAPVSYTHLTLPTIYSV